MLYRNTSTEYGLVTVILHWAMALLIIGLFALGLWMTSLTYYDPWYKQGPDLHRSFGVVVLLLLAIRFAWRVRSGTPNPEPGNKPWEVAVAHLVHLSFYFLIVLIGISGYLISTADGRAITVFGWFDIPAIGPFVKYQEEIAGAIHLGLAVMMMVLVVLHAAAAIKHHFIDHDRTLLRMLGGKGTAPTITPRTQQENKS